MRAPDLSRAIWRKSSYSNGTGGSCVEVALIADVPGTRHGVGVRDSKDPHGPALTFTARQWGEFMVAIKAHEFDLA
jgi:Domain of unknown function (DUF397)